MPDAAKPAVLVTAAKLAPEAVAILEAAGYAVPCTSGYPSEAELLAAIAAHRPVALLHRQGIINGTVMDAAAPGLRVIARHGAGVDGIDLAAAEARGLTVTRAAGANSRSVAEHAMALMLAMLKDLPAVQAGMRDGALGEDLPHDPRRGRRLARHPGLRRHRLEGRAHGRRLRHAGRGL